MKNMNMRITTSIFIVIAACASALAQEEPLERARVGLFGNYGIGMHAASFSQLPGIANCCPEFGTTSGSGFFVGLLYSTPLDKTLSLQLRAHYSRYGVGFSESETQVVAGEGVPYDNAVIRHTIDAKFSQISIEPLIGYSLTRDFKLLGGITAGYIVSSTFDQIETLEQPAAATFAGGRRTRNAISGDIPDASSIAAGITIGMSYDLALNADRTMFLSPEVLFTYSPIGVASGVSWNAHQLRAGLALSLMPPPVEDTLSDIELLQVARSIVPPKKGAPGVPFAANITATGLNEDGRTAPLESVRIEEFASNRIRPLLPYIFFGASDANIPTRYRSLGSNQVANFSVDNFYNLDAMMTYHHVLNIVGKRMLDEPSATLSLTGCSDPSDGPNASEIAAQRAASVKKYLVSTWGIDAGRIATESRGLPELASNVEEADGRDENRRVEIRSSTASILDPVSSVDTMRVFSPAGVQFQPSIDPTVPIASYTLFVTQGEQLIRTFYGNEPAIPPTIAWRMDEQSRFIPSSARDLEYLLVVRDTAGQVIPSSTRSIALSQVTLADKSRSGGTDKNIDKYSMIMFGFNKSDLSPANQQFVDRIKSRISPTSTTSVLGYTDRSGSEDYNQRLSEQRARSVATALGLPGSVAQGRGESLPLYDNQSPEGRFYSRTVEVVVETPRR